MIEEPYRWVEAVANRRDYVREQLKAGAPVFAASLSTGILLLGVGTGQSKVFELFDRHALAGLGHPADIEKIRQAAIDAAHMEAFTRAPEDVSLRRLVSFGLSPQLKTNFEQIFSAPFLVELVLVELGQKRDEDLLVRLHFDGAFESRSGGVVVATGSPEMERQAGAWLSETLKENTDRRRAIDLFLQAWWCLLRSKSFGEAIPSEAERQAGWRAELKEGIVELGWLDRQSGRPARYEPLPFGDLRL